MSKNTESRTVGPRGPKQEKASGKTQCQTQLLEGVSATSRMHVQKTESSEEAVDTPPDEVQQELNGEESNDFNQNPYVQQYYTGYVHLYHVLDRHLSAIQSELNYMSRGVDRFTNHMKECSDTMDFCVTRMLSLQKETLYALDKTNGSLQSAVHLLREIKENQEQRPQGSSSATRDTEQDNLPNESNSANKRQKGQQNSHRFQSGHSSTHHPKRYKEK